MRTNNRSMVGYIVGLIWAVGFFLRYFIIYSDISQGIIYISIGVGIIAFSWIYDVITRLSDTSYAMGSYLNDLRKLVDEIRHNRKVYKHI